MRLDQIVSYRSGLDGISLVQPRLSLFVCLCSSSFVHFILAGKIKELHKRCSTFMVTYEISACLIFDGR